MQALSLSPALVTEVEVLAAKVHRIASEERPLDLTHLRDATANLQALIAEATSLERRADARRRAEPADAPADAPAFFADTPGETAAEALPAS